MPQALTYLADAGYAIEINPGFGQESSNVIGGPDAGRPQRDYPGRFVPTTSIVLEYSTGNFIQGNYIGVNKDGTAALQSPVGSVAIAIGNGIGQQHASAGKRHLRHYTGVLLTGGSTGSNVIQGNFIGTNATGTAGLGGGQSASTSRA